MIKKILNTIKQNKDIISYLFWGVCTTVINIVSYSLFYDVLKCSNVLSTCIAWILSVVFAYITNKLFVFESKSFEPSVLVKEVLQFFSCRLMTGILDLVIMYVTVDVLSLKAILWKIISNIIVIVLNYVASKLIIFNNKSGGQNE